MMKKRRRIRFKINNDTMSSIVIYSLVFCAGITIAGMVLGAFDHDVSAVVDSTHRVFGTELGICGLMKLYDKGRGAGRTQSGGTQEKKNERKASGMGVQGGIERK